MSNPLICCTPTDSCWLLSSTMLPLRVNTQQDRISETTSTRQQSPPRKFFHHIIIFHCIMSTKVPRYTNLIILVGFTHHSNGRSCDDHPGGCGIHHIMSKPSLGVGEQLQAVWDEKANELPVYVIKEDGSLGCRVGFAALKIRHAAAWDRDGSAERRSCTRLTTARLYLMVKVRRPLGADEPKSKPRWCQDQNLTSEEDKTL